VSGSPPSRTAGAAPTTVPIPSPPPTPADHEAAAPRTPAPDVEELPLCERPATPVSPPASDLLTLQATIAALRRGSGPIALDTERASGFRYDQRAYLLQFRRAGAGTQLVDPLAFQPTPVADGTAEPTAGTSAQATAACAAALAEAEWVLHAARQDLPCLVHLGLVPVRLFDTELAARLLNRPRVGLAHLVAAEFGLRLAKEHSAADWSTRPIPPQWLDYAALDVEFLLPLRDILESELREQGRWPWAMEEFAAIVEEAQHLARTGPPPPPADAWRRTGGIHRVRSARGMATVRQLWRTRDRIARELDLAPHRVLPDAAIIAAAMEPPAGRGGLTAIPGFATRRARAHVADWAAAIADAQAMPDEELPRRQHEDPADPPPARLWRDRDPVAAARLTRVRTAVAAHAEHIGVPAENLIAPESLRRICWPPIPEPADESAVRDALRRCGARTWQCDLVSGVIARSLPPEAA